MISDSKSSDDEAAVPPSDHENDQPVTEENVLDEVPSDVEDIDLTHYRMRKWPSFERFEKLTRLCMRQNLLPDCSGLRQVSALVTDLDLYDNRIETITDVEHLTQQLDFSFNLIKNIERLEPLVKLKVLYFVQNKISRISGLETLVNLDSLELGANRIKDIENLGTLVNLTELFLGKNKISKIQGLDTLVNLRLLSIQSNRITKIEGLDKLVNLKELYLSHNGIETLEGLEQNINLNVLDVGSNRISKMQNLSHLKNLEEFWASGNLFESYEDIETELKPIATLRTVYFEANPIQKDVQYRLKLKMLLPTITQIDATYVRAT